MFAGRKLGISYFACLSTESKKPINRISLGCLIYAAVKQICLCLHRGKNNSSEASLCTCNLSFSQKRHFILWWEMRYNLFNNCGLKWCHASSEQAGCIGEPKNIRVPFLVSKFREDWEMQISLWSHFNLVMLLPQGFWRPSKTNGWVYW